MPDTATADLFEGLDVSFDAKVSTLRLSRDLAQRILRALVTDHAPGDAGDEWWEGWQDRARAILGELGTGHPLHPHVLGLTQDEDFFASELRLEVAVNRWLRDQEVTHG